MKSIFNLFSFLLTMVLLISACGQPDNPTGNTVADETANASSVKGQSSVPDSDSEQNVLQVAIGSQDHSTLVAAVQAAELEDVLVNAGPLTDFAPTNAAFDELPAGTVDDLLKPENKAKLSKIIKYHASPGKYVGPLLKDGMRLYMASGHYVPVSVNGDEVRVGEAKVLGTVEASNGVVHVVDKVLLPPE